MGHEYESARTWASEMLSSKRMPYQAAVDETKPHYILWNPKSDLPPTARFSSVGDAEKVAEVMARKFPGQEFRICKVIGSAKIATAPVSVTFFTRKGSK